MARFQDVVTAAPADQGRSRRSRKAAGCRRTWQQADSRDDVEEMKDAIIALARLESLEVVDSLPEEASGRAR